MQDFEKLAAFYLGRRHDVDTGETTDEPLVYDAKDLTTHAVCVGMTGSGKTGLCISLLEEAAIDGIPALVIDPKGDMSNLLLTFPGLAPADFEPWIDPAEAERNGMDTPAYAASVADTWKNGLADWGQDGERIQRLKDAADFAVYTPGSTAGIPLTVLRSFAAPPAEQMEDAELLADRIQGAAAGLLGLLGIDADPIQSREAILVANILQHHWKNGRSLGIADLVREIQSPPFERLGVLDVETFYPAKDRAALAMALNGLLASPSFAQWMEGEALDVAKLLHTDKGKPRISILSIAHLSESERMFFVTLLLNEVVSWMRTQTGTSSLRAILYMDEIFGYFPPTKEPPSKKPMLTLLKQARAYGLGVCLSTQNPVDLDYKGLSNTGTWFLGRLQTERDKARVLDGLEGAMTGGGKVFDRSRLDSLLSGLGKRVFLMHNVHDDQPVVFRTRWAMSYLRGPLSRGHLKTLTAGAKAADAKIQSKAVPAPKPAAPVEAPKEAQRPVLAPEVQEHFLEPEGRPSTDRLVYRPTVVAATQLHYANVRAKIDTWVKVAVRAPIAEDDPAVDWEGATLIEGEATGRYDTEPHPSATFSGLPPAAGRAKSYTTWQRSLKNHMYKVRALTMWKNPTYKLVSEFGESERDFRSRVADAAREKRDEKIEKLRDSYAPKLVRVQERIRKAEQKIDREEEQFREKRSSSFVSVGSTILGALFGRKLASATNVRRAGSAAKSVGRVSKEKADIERAKEDLEAQHQNLADLEAKFTESLGELDVRVRADEMELDEITVRPRKSDIEVSVPAILWTPWYVDSTGIARPAFE